MTLCPFLSSVEENVDCFEECVLYNGIENEKECPFKNLNSNGKTGVGKSKKNYKFEAFLDKENSDEDEYNGEYEENFNDSYDDSYKDSVSDFEYYKGMDD